MKRLLLFVLLACLGVTFSQSTQAMGGGWVIDDGYFQVTHVCRDGYLFTRASVLTGQANYNSVLNFAPSVFGPFTAELTDDMVDENGVITGDDFVLDAKYYPRLGPRGSISESQIEEVQDYEILESIQDRFVAEDVPAYFYDELDVGAHVLLYGTILPVEDCHIAKINSTLNAQIPKARFGATDIAFPEEELIYEFLELPSNGLANNVPLNIGDKLQLSEMPENGLTYTASDIPEDEVEYLRYSVRGTTRVSVNTDGEQSAGGNSFEPSISAAGFDVAFTSDATNLSDISNSNVSDVFVHRRFTGMTSLVSYEQNGGDTGDSGSPEISPDGFRVVYASAGENLLSNDATCLEKTDNNSVTDIFLYGNGATKRLSLFDPDGEPCQQFTNSSANPSMADANFGQEGVVFETNEPLELPFYDDTNNDSDLLLNQNFNGIDNVPVSGINNLDIAPSPGLTPTLDMPNDGSTTPKISADGNVIAFQSDATDLIRTISGNPADLNGVADIYISEWNGSRWVSSLISRTSDGDQASGGDSRNPSVSQFGQHIAFESNATNLFEQANRFSQIFVRDRQAGCTTILSISANDEIGFSHSVSPSISANGRYVAFTSSASNLIDDDTNSASDIFVVDRDADGDHSYYTDSENCVAGPRSIMRISVASDGTQSNGASFDADISDNGQFVAFASDATNLIQDDTNGLTDVFVHYLGYTGAIRFETELVVETCFSCVYLPIVTKP